MRSLEDRSEKEDKKNAPKLKDQLESRKAKMLSIVAYGCNRTVHAKMKRAFKKIGYETFYYYDYFLLNPSLRTQNDDNSLEIFAPYLERILQRSDFIPDIEEFVKGAKSFPTNRLTIKSIPKTSQAVKNFLQPHLTKTKFDYLYTGGWLLYKFWKDRKVVELDKEKSETSKYKLYIVNEQFPVLEMSHYIKHLNESYLSRIKRYGGDDMIPYLKDFLVVAEPWIKTKRSPRDKLDAFYVPIASDEVFYGFGILFYKKERRKKIDKKRREIIYKALYNVVKKQYLPILILFENYWEEFVLKEALKNERDKKEENKDRRDVDKQKNGNNVIKWKFSKNGLEDLRKRIDSEVSEKGIENSKKRKDGKLSEITIEIADVKDESDTASLPLVFLDIKRAKDNHLLLLEKGLNTIWEARKKFANELFNEKKKGKLDEILDKIEGHLLFANYNVASPGMLSLVEQIVNLNSEGANKSLSSALVIGGPGSGKDTLAKLIGLFNEKYTGGRIIPINMASYKPEALSTPLIAGLKLDGIAERRSGSGTDSALSINLNGLFEQIADEQPATLILDELNSLDIDAQGALLRIIENGEITPLGTIPKGGRKEPKILVIGVMNEDPMMLTKESTLRQILTQEKLFGGFLGEVLYEHVRGIRRLREDLYYRLIRGGKFTVPELSERREDIPILFYIYSDQFAGSNEINIDFDAFEILMSETINWPGNIRQLQAVARKVVDKKLKDKRTERIIAKKPKEKEKSKEETIDITADDVEKVLKEMDMLPKEEDNIEDEDIEYVEHKPSKKGEANNKGNNS
jgi:DNA-binding NtrC family response regulator